MADTTRIVIALIVLLLVVGIGYYVFTKEEKKRHEPLTSSAIINLVNMRLRLPSQPVGEAVAAKLNSTDKDLTQVVMNGDADGLIDLLLKINGVAKMPSGAKVGFLIYGCPSTDGTTFYAYDGQKSATAPPCPSQ